MKKYFFIIGLLATIFLWLGNTTFAKTDAECKPAYDLCKASEANCTWQITQQQLTLHPMDYYCQFPCEQDKKDCLANNDVLCSDKKTSCTPPEQCSCSNRWCTCKSSSELDSEAKLARQQACEDAMPAGTSLTTFQQTLCDCGVSPEAIPSLEYLNTYSNAINKKSDWNGCCVTEDGSTAFKGVLSMCTNADQNAWEACSPAKANAHVNAVWYCTCNDWYTDVDGTCRKCTDPWVCCGVKLNTNIPFIGNCIETKSQDSTSIVDETTAFPILVSAIVKILMSLILVVCFILIVVGGVRIAVSGADPAQAAGGKKMIFSVVIALAVLGAIGVILHLINPNFFG